MFRNRFFFFFFGFLTQGLINGIAYFLSGESAELLFESLEKGPLEIFLSPPSTDAVSIMLQLQNT